MGLDFIKNHGGQRTTETKRTNAFAEINGVQLRRFLTEYEKMRESGKNGGGAELSAAEIQTIGEQIGLMKIELEMRTKSCRHSSKLGDNYGVSCALCGAQIAGYGFGGYFGAHLENGEKCIHEFINDGEEKSCRYCELPEKNQ